MAIDDSNNSNSSKKMSALLTNSSATFFGGGSTAKTTMTAEEFIAEFGERIKKEVTEPVGKAVSFSNKPDSLQTRTSPSPNNRNLEARVTVTKLKNDIEEVLGKAVRKTAETITKNEDETALNSSPKI